MREGEGGRRRETHVVIHVMGDDRFLIGEEIGEGGDVRRTELTGIWVRYRRNTLATSWVV